MNPAKKIGKKRLCLTNTTVLVNWMVGDTTRQCEEEGVEEFWACLLARGTKDLAQSCPK
jgi:hypothetical protein